MDLNTKTHIVPLPQKGWIHDGKINNNLNRAYSSFNNNPYKDTAGFKHIMLSSAVSKVETSPSNAINSQATSRHSGFINKSLSNKL